MRLDLELTVQTPAAADRPEMSQRLWMGWVRDWAADLAGGAYP